MKKWRPYSPISFVAYLFCMSSFSVYGQTTLCETIDHAKVLSDFVSARVMTKEEAAMFDVPDSVYSGGSKLEIFFEALKNPTESSLATIRTILCNDNEMLYALDPETGLPPHATLMVCYPSGTAEQKRQYRELFTYFHEMGVSCDYNLEHEQPFILNVAELTDLEEIYLRYNPDEPTRWKDACERLQDRSNTSVRLHNVAYALSQHLEGITKQKLEPKQEPSSQWNILLVLVGAAIGYGVHRYLTQNNPQKKKAGFECAAERAHVSGSAQ